MYFLADWTRRVDFDRMRARRLVRAGAALTAAGVDAVVVLRPENARYLSGLRPLWMPNPQLRNGAIMGRHSGRTVALASGGDWDHRRSTMYWMTPGHVLPFPPMEDGALAIKAMPVIREGLELVGVCASEQPEARIGLDLVTLRALETFQSTFPGWDFVDVNDELLEARRVKNEDEVAVFRQACQAVDLGFERAAGALRVGRRECEVLGDIMQTFYALGMEIPQCNLIVASGENLAPLQRFASDRPIRAGDLVFMDIGGCFNGMFAEATRTMVCGSPSQEQRRIYHCVYEAQMTIFKQLKPGLLSTDLHHAVAEVFAQHGYADYALSTVIGHGIGIACWEPPTVGDPSMTGAPFAFEEGMTLSFEPTIVVPGVTGGGTVRLEDEVVITADGCEVLTRAPYDERLLP